LFNLIRFIRGAPEAMYDEKKEGEIEVISPEWESQIEATIRPIF